MASNFKNCLQATFHTSIYFFYYEQMKYVDICTYSEKKQMGNPQCAQPRPLTGHCANIYLSTTINIVNGSINCDARKPRNDAGLLLGALWRPRRPASAAALVTRCIRLIARALFLARGLSGLARLCLIKKRICRSTQLRASMPSAAGPNTKAAPIARERRSGLHGQP